MSPRTANLLFPAALLCGVGMVVAAWWRVTHDGPQRIHFSGPQAAAAPFAMPADGEPPDLRLRALTPWQLARTPVATRFDPPLGGESSALVYNAQPFWEMNERRGGHHTGDDLNGIGGMNTDLGDPVFATADGLVVYAGDPSPGWGNIVILNHRTAAGECLQSMYAHLDRIDVTPGEWVARGWRIATVGTAHGMYPAHLHFEIRRGDGVDIGGGYGQQPLNRLDPAATVRALRGAAADDLAPSPLGVALRAGR